MTIVLLYQHINQLRGINMNRTLKTGSPTF